MYRNRMLQEKRSISKKKYVNSTRKHASFGIRQENIMEERERDMEIIKINKENKENRKEGKLKKGIKRC